MNKAKVIIIGTILLAFALPVNARTQLGDLYTLYYKFEKLYSSCDFIKAEECLLQILDSKEIISEEFLGSTYNNLGIVNSTLGRYKKSLEFFDQAEFFLKGKHQQQHNLAVIYSNKARIYNIQKKYTTAIEYIEKALRIYNEANNPEKYILESTANSFMNMGISYQGLKKYSNAMKNFERSAGLKLKYHLPGLGLSYLNMANTFVLTGNKTEAEKFFLKSISEFEKGSAIYYQRIIDVYFDYGIFLSASGRESEALEIQSKALALSLKNFGGKHPHVSQSYKNLGDHYLKQSDCNIALQYYQKAIIALVTNFEHPEINVNPSIDSSLLDLDLLKILQKKSEALEELSFQQKIPEMSRQTMSESLESIELALQLITRIRNDYLSEESQLYLAENEKETYIFAAHICQGLYNLTHDPVFLQKMYNIARQSKSAILHNEISGNEVLYSFGLPDSLVQKLKRISEDIAAYKHLIHLETRNAHPDSTKTDFWKDALFGMNRQKESLEADLNKQYPQYSNLLRKTEPVSLSEIQNHLKKDEVMVEYLLSNKYTNGLRKLYIFTVTRNELNFQESFLDTLFAADVETIKQSIQQVQFSGDRQGNYRKYTGALFHMYDKLVRPVENSLTDKKLIVIPDEEIAYLPFDAFIKQLPDHSKSDYEGLQYLVKYYSFSYGFSSSLIFSGEKKKMKGEAVYAFSPDYRKTTEISGKGFENLLGTGKEIKAIYKFFRGKEFLAGEASESNFKSVMKYPVIMHLAMHSQSDTGNSKYSCLVFDSPQDSTEDGALYDYEISLSRINSPMVVLSACNTGSGELFRGEGLMSITRAFILAGASSVIKTLWDVNDASSAGIISSFYYHLSRGKDKDDAIRLAKLEYLETSTPSYTNPYYWAAYQVMGDKSSIIKSRKTVLVMGLIALLILGGGVFYFKRRRRLSA